MPVSATTIRRPEDAMVLGSGYQQKVLTAAPVCLLAVSLAAGVAAQVPVHLEPRHPIAFASETLRVLNVNIEAGDTTLDHIHAYDIAVVCISGCELRTRPLGEDWSDWLARAPGQVNVIANAGNPSSHRHQAGNSHYHVISVENLRQRGWSTDAPLAGLAPQFVNETRAFRIYDTHLGVGEAEAEHVHAHAVVAILVSGEVIVEGKGPQPSKGLSRSSEWAVIPAGAAHRIVNRGASEAQLVEVEVR
jgi:quercetin dioxygenase-like cupin family protein